MSIDKTREAFEAWAKPRLFNMRRIKASPDQYLSMDSECAWQAWSHLAAANAQEVKRLREALTVVINTIHSVENRCMAADGPVTPTCDEITDTDLRAMYDAARAALQGDK